LLHLFTSLKSNFATLFFSRNRLLALSDATLLLASHCYAGHTNKKCVSPGYWHTGHSPTDYRKEADKTAGPMIFMDFVCNENISKEP
jgi:hypothetical protein